MTRDKDPLPEGVKALLGKTVRVNFKRTGDQRIVGELSRNKFTNDWLAVKTGPDIKDLFWFQAGDAYHISLA